MKKFEGLVVGIRGKRRSGKDFVAKEVLLPHFTKIYGYTNVGTVSYADSLREVVHNTYGISYELMFDPKLKEHPLPDYPVNPKDPLSQIICDYFKDKKAFPQVDGDFYWTPRLLLIAEGQFKRAINPNHWADYTHDIILKHRYEIVFIPDARFPEGELKGLRALGGKLVQIERSLQNRGLEKELDDPSETLADSWTDWDDVWDNNGTKEDLANLAISKVEYWLRENK